MINILLILLFFIVSLPICYFLSKGDVGRPLMIVWLSGVFSIICSCYRARIDSLYINDQTCMLVLLGLFGFLVGCSIGSIKSIKSRKLYIHNKALKGNVISVTYTRQIVLLGMYGIFTLILIRTIRVIFGNSLLGVLQMSSLYRDYFISGEGALPFVVQQFFRLFRIICFYLIYVVVNNIYNKRPFKEYVLMIICIGLFAVQNFVQGSRSDIIYIFFSAICVFLIEFQRNSNKKTIPMKTVLKAIVIVIVVFSLFAITRTAFGRTGAASVSLSIVDYLAFYFGESIFNFNYYIEKGIIEKRLVGRTFGTLVNNLSKYVDTGETIKRLDHVYLNGTYSGNTYTAFCKYFADWGVFGVFFFSFLFGLIISIIYHKVIMSKEWSLETRFWTCMYGYLSPGLFLVLYDEHFFSTKVSFGLIIDIIGIIAIDYYVTMRMNKRKRMVFRRKG